MSGGVRGWEGVVVEPGGRGDYTLLASGHYRAERTGPIDRILRARSTCGGVVGVLVAVHPALNGSWREAAWPGHFRGPARERARAINASLRTIARVIVAPSHRGLGIATGLVRAYLAAPATPLTEAIAAMGPFSGFFVAAGMRARAVRPDGADRRLLAELRRHHLHPSRLLSPARSDVRTLRSIAPALVRWSRSGRGRAAPTLEGIARLAGERLAVRRIAFTHGEIPPPADAPPADVPE